MGGSPQRHLAQWSYAGFFQDDWRITPKLTVNLGLRYEYFGPPSEANDLIGNFCPNLPNNVGVTSCPAMGLEQVGQQISSVFRPDRKNFSPRLGVAWDPQGREGPRSALAEASATITHSWANSSDNWRLKMAPRRG